LVCSFSLVGIVIGLVLIGTSTSAHAQSSSIKINEVTKYYRIKGKTAPEFALSMSKKGPYSRQHRRRAWATATRDMTYQLYHQKTKSRCKIKGVKVRLKITYQMPKLSSTRGVSKRHRRNWNRMYGLLNKHERTHGLYYKQFARKAYGALRKLKPQRSCAALERSAKKLVDRLGKADKKRNVDFDRRDRRNYRSMERIYSGA
jgi:predicted secreted Zn-dependent protease